jgi:hypothetical protein
LTDLLPLRVRPHHRVQDREQLSHTGDEGDLLRLADRDEAHDGPAPGAALKMRLPFKRIREIDTAKKFYDVQTALGAAAREAGVPRVWFDDNWSDREG